MKHFLLPEDWDGRRELDLTGSPFHYLCRVRRFRVGDPIPCRSTEGVPFTARILSVGADYCRIRLTDRYPPERNSTFLRDTETPEDLRHSGAPSPSTAFTLIAAITKGRKMDLTVRQAVEAGAAEIWPVFGDHTVIRLPEENARGGKTERWRRIAREAVQQSGSLAAPKVETPQPLAEALNAWGNRGPMILFHEAITETTQEDSENLHTLLADPPEEAAIMIGPEGGWSTGEVETLRARGASIVHLGSQVLRSETAALYALAAVQTILRERKSWRPSQNV